MKVKKILMIVIPIVVVCILAIFLILNNVDNRSLEELFENKEYAEIVTNYLDGEYAEITDWKTKKLIAESAFFINDYELSYKVYTNILEDKFINDLERANLLYDYSMTLIKLRLVDEAFVALQEGIEESAADLTVSKKLKRSYGLLARSFPREYNIENALNYLYDCIALDISGDDYEAHYSYALLLYYVEEYENSLFHAKKALAIKHDHYNSQTLIPKIYFESDNIDKATSYLKELIIQYPTDYSLKLYLAQITELNGDYDTALNLYKKTVEYKKDEIEARMGLIRCYIKKNQINALIDEINIFNSIFPTENKYTETIEKLMEKYMPKLITDKQELNKFEIE